MKGKLRDYSTSMMGGKMLTIEITDGDARNLFDEYGMDRELEISLSIPRRRRSLDANAYAWVLIDQLAAKIHQPKEQVYREIIRDIGGNSEALQIKTAALDAFDRAWSAGHIGRFTEIISMDEYEGMTWISAYYGSSDYDTKTMSRLIDRVIEDCKDQGIDTMTPKERDRLLQQWGERYGRA